MQVVDFKGAEELVTMLDRAVREDGDEATAGEVQEGLEDLIRRQILEIPGACCRPLPDAYARRLLYRSDDHGYTVIAMTWGPRQGTPIHDHAGMWCVEGVWQGRIEVVQYDLMERREDLYRFQEQEAVQAGVGSAGSLIPPFDYHTITNPAADATAVTIHVYGGEMEHCSVFEPVGDGWCRCRERRLSYDA